MLNFWKKHDVQTNNYFKKDYSIKNYIDELKIINDKMIEKDNMICSIQEDYKYIFNVFSECIVIIDSKGTVIDLNRKSQIEFSNIVNNTIIGKEGKEVLQSMGCLGENSLEQKVINHEIKTEASKEIYVKKVDKYFIISVIPVYKNEKIDYFLFVAKDITNIKRREIELIKKQQIIHAIEQITDVFTKNVNINYIMEKSLEKLIYYINNIDMAYIYKNCIDINGELYAEKIKVCTAPYIKQDKINLDKFFYKETFPRGKEFFDVNHIICGHIKNFPKNERYLLEQAKIKSICVVPIYTPISLWGFIGFDSFLLERIGTYDEEKALKVAAHVIGAGIYQGSLRNNVNEIIDKTCISF